MHRSALSFTQELPIERRHTWRVIGRLLCWMLIQLDREVMSYQKQTAAYLEVV